MAWTKFLFILVVSLLGQNLHAQPEDGYGSDEEDMGMGDGFGDGDGMGGDGPSGFNQLQELKSADDFDNFINNTDASVIGAFLAEKIHDPKSKKPEDWDDDEDGDWEPPEIENPPFASFKSISSALDYRFAYSVAPQVLEKIKTKTGGVYLYRSPYYVSKDHGDRARERFASDTLSQAGIEHWLETKAQPLVGEYSTKTQDRYKSAVLIIIMNLDFNENAKSVKYVLKRARKVALGLKGKLAVAVAAISSMRYDFTDYGLSSDSDGDILMAIRGGPDFDAPKYGASRDKSFSEKTLSEFANAYLAGELTAHKREDYTESTEDSK